jgi:hypothetical protein
MIITLWLGLSPAGRCPGQLISYPKFFASRSLQKKAFSKVAASSGAEPAEFGLFGCSTSQTAHGGADWVNGYPSILSL